MSKIVTLSDGVQIELSTRKSNNTGYTGACLSPDWTLKSTVPFIAARGWRDIDRNRMAYKKSTSWHGGHYADAREAAYVVGMFNIDPYGLEEFFIKNGRKWTDFPSDLYTNPTGMLAEEAIKLLSGRILTKKELNNKDNSASDTATRAPKQPPLTTPIYGNNDALSVAFRYAKKEMPDYNDKHPKLRDIATAIGENMLWFRKDADIAKVVRKVIAA